LAENNWKLSNHRSVLLAYFFVIFGIIGGLNTQTAIQTLSWGGSGTGTFSSIYEDPSFDNIEVWYFLAGIIFFVPLPIFIGLFVYYYFRTQINVASKKRFILEFFYLSLAGGFSTVALRIPRIILVVFADIDPSYTKQKIFLMNSETSMAEWSLGTFKTIQALHDDVPFLLLLIGIYFGVLYFLHRLRKWRLPPKNDSQG